MQATASRGDINRRDAPWFLFQLLYDNHLRDRDLDPEVIIDIGHVVRLRLSCRAAENLMLSDDALALAGTDWVSLQQKTRGWVTENEGHQYHGDVDGFDRKGHDLKPIRNILSSLMTNKPWEVLVGQSIARTIETPTEEVRRFIAGLSR